MKDRVCTLRQPLVRRSDYRVSESVPDSGQLMLCGVPLGASWNGLNSLTADHCGDSEANRDRGTVLRMCARVGVRRAWESAIRP